MIRLTDADGDPVLLAENSILIITKYVSPGVESGYVERKFLRQPKSVVHTITGALIPVVEDHEEIQNKIRFGEVND